MRFSCKSLWVYFHLNKCIFEGWFWLLRFIAHTCRLKLIIYKGCIAQQYKKYKVFWYHKFWLKYYKENWINIKDLTNYVCCVSILFSILRVRYLLLNYDFSFEKNSIFWSMIEIAKSFCSLCTIFSLTFLMHHTNQVPDCLYFSIFISPLCTLTTQGPSALLLIHHSWIFELIALLMINSNYFFFLPLKNYIFGNFLFLIAFHVKFIVSQKHHQPFWGQL